MLQLIYISSATVPFSPADLKQLLRRARENNAALGISGMLVFKDGQFLQILEGEHTAVQDLFELIEKDKRHGSMKLLLRTEAEERSFGEWTMGFVDATVTKDDVAHGYVDFLRTGVASLEGDGGRAKKVLMGFRDGAWRNRVNTD